MDVSAVRFTLHPLAKDALFKDYRTLRYIFSNVLGQLETDYLSIALVDQSRRLIFLSSHPSIEQNLIDQGLWQFDGCFQPAFVFQDEMRTWSELYHPDYEIPLYRYKQVAQAFKAGFSIPTDFEEFRAVFSFGFKSANPLLHQKIFKQQEKLLAMGKYCLREITQAITLPHKAKVYQFKPHLKLVTNNQVCYENSIREE